MYICVCLYVTRNIFLILHIYLYTGESCFLWAKMTPKVGGKNPAIETNLLLKELGFLTRMMAEEPEKASWVKQYKDTGMYVYVYIFEYVCDLYKYVYIYIYIYVYIHVYINTAIKLDIARKKELELLGDKKEDPLTVARELLALSDEEMVRIRMYLYMYIYIHTSIRAHIYYNTLFQIYVYAYMYICIFIFIFIFIFIHELMI
jgi:hypothetical protein